MGLRRGKSDKADAWEIASYVWLRREELVPSTPPAKKLIELQRMMSLREQLVKQLTASKNLYKAMNELIKQDETMITNYRLSKTVKGVGMVLAIQMLLHTHNYTRFESSRQFSAYCGLVPYPYQSGTSIHGRHKIHGISDKKMKSLLSMSAISAIQHDKELKLYYQKRVEEGKPKMVVLNIIRNKIVSRVFATVQRGTPYVEINKFYA